MSETNLPYLQNWLDKYNYNQGKNILLGDEPKDVLFNDLLALCSHLTDAVGALQRQIDDLNKRCGLHD